MWKIYKGKGRKSTLFNKGTIEKRKKRKKGAENKAAKRGKIKRD